MSYTNVPVPSSAPAFKHANSGASIKSIVASVERVVAKHPLRDGSGRYAVNLPAGTTPETARTIVSRLGGGAMVPYEGMGEDVPVYHISRIWLRGATGKVDVVYPFVDQRGARIDGGVTVWVHGGDRSWYVERMQYWAPGTVPTPPLYVPVGKDGAGEVDGDDVGGDVEMMDTEGYESPTTEPEVETVPVVDQEVRTEPVRVSEPAETGLMYREIHD